MHRSIARVRLQRYPATRMMSACQLVSQQCRTHLHYRVMGQTMPRYAMACLLIAFAACDVSKSLLPADAETFEPPAVYTRWWRMTAACSGHERDMRAIRW